MNRNKALYVYLAGTIGQIFITCIVVFLLRSIEIKIDYSTPIGMLAIGIGGTSSALWGAIVAAKYKKIPVRKILIDFIDLRQSYSSYLYMILFLALNFCYLLIGGEVQVSVWYLPIIIFLKSILFGGIEEIGWRYTFQPILEEKINYILATIITFLSWGVWHLLYFYIDGSLSQIQVKYFMIGLFTNCFILSALYNKTKSLWICVMAHAFINMLSQISSGGNTYVVFICRGIIILLSIAICKNEKRRKFQIRGEIK